MTFFYVRVSDENLPVIMAGLGSINTLGERFDAILRRFDAIFEYYKDSV